MTTNPLFKAITQEGELLQNSAFPIAIAVDTIVTCRDSVFIQWLLGFIYLLQHLYLADNKTD
jgi:hypothetical protein